LTYPAAPKIAAAIARQKSTSNPAHRPCPSGKPKPASPRPDPQTKRPRFLTSASVPAEASQARMKRTANAMAIFLTISCFLNASRELRAPGQEDCSRTAGFSMLGLTGQGSKLQLAAHICLETK